jgi:hypothetical protein
MGRYSTLADWSLTPNGVSGRLATANDCSVTEPKAGHSYSLIKATPREYFCVATLSRLGAPLRGFGRRRRWARNLAHARRCLCNDSGSGHAEFDALSHHARLCATARECRVVRRVC